MDTDITEYTPKKFLMIVNDRIQDSIQSSGTNRIIQLRHPRSDEAFMVYISTSEGGVFLNEVVKFEEPYSSWFIQNDVQSDGSLYLLTPIDSRLIALPYLLEKSTQFMPLDEILEDENYHDLRLLSAYSNVISSLKDICDVKEIGGTLVMKYSEEKLINWFIEKIGKLAEFLKNRPQSVESSATASNYIKSLKGSTVTPDLTAFSCGMFCEYLPNEIEEKLKKSLGINEVVMRKIENQVNSKKRKSNSSGPNEDYSEISEVSAKKPMTRKTLSQKRLESVDKTGMKSISTFFKPRKN